MRKTTIVDGKLISSEGLNLVCETKRNLVYVANDYDFSAISLTVSKKGWPKPAPKRLIVTTTYQPEFE